jgi:hypothetical protein
MMGELVQQNFNAFFCEVMNGSPEFITNKYEYMGDMDRYENRRRRIIRFESVNSDPVVIPPQFVRIVGNEQINTFNKVSEPIEKVNWKEEGF